MTEFVSTYPTARTRHTCTLCWRRIQPGETYLRQAGLDGGSAWTNKTCEHCDRVTTAYCRDMGEGEWWADGVVEWLSEYAPALHAAMLAGWRYPDGELVAPPFPAHCYTCGDPIPYRSLWCGPCDDARIERLGGQFAAVRQALAGIVR